MQWPQIFVDKQTDSKLGLTENSKVLRGANKRRICYVHQVAVCLVSYCNLEGIEHQVQVEAETLFEAVGNAVSIFRAGLWIGCPPGPGCSFKVRVLPRLTADLYGRAQAR